MPERGGDHGDSWRGEEGSEGGSYGPDEQLRRALAQERHAQEARRYFETAPLYRIKAEENNTWSVAKKRYEYWPNRPPAAATQWPPISTHPDFEQAERRLGHVASPPVYYDERGRLARAPTVE